MRTKLMTAAALIFPTLLMQSAALFAATEYHGEGIINRVEPVLGIVNITHGPVAVIGWETMTRDVHVKPRELISGLMPGMRVRFQVTTLDPLTHVITALEPVE